MPTPLDPATLTALLHELADASGAHILPHFREPLRIENKTGHRTGYDPVTQADKAAENAIRAILAQRVPDHAIFGEEFGGDTAPEMPGDTPSSAAPPAAVPPTTALPDYRWVIDPIDGTRAFILGLPTWGTLIGLEISGRPTLGIMNQPYTGERFWTDGTHSYFQRGSAPPVALKTRKTTLAAAQMATTAPELFATGVEHRAFESLKSKTLSCRYGGDCYAYCMLAAGLIDVVMEAGLHPYDIAALIPIVENAGGRVTTWSGAPANAGGRILACGDRDLHAQLLEIIAPIIAEPNASKT